MIEIDHRLFRFIDEATYCASFSAKGDDLSQYRAYSKGGAGYCLGYDSHEMKQICSRYLTENGVYLKLVPVIYIETHQSNYIRQMKNVVCEFAQRNAHFKFEDSETCEAFKISLSYLRTLIYSFKKSGFRDEKEWRIVFLPDKSTHKAQRKDFDSVPRGDILVPILKIATVNEEGKHSLRKIFVGPKLHFDSAKYGLERFIEFRKKYIKGIEILPSNTRLR